VNTTGEAYEQWLAETNTPPTHTLDLRKDATLRREKSRIRDYKRRGTVALAYLEGTMDNIRKELLSIEDEIEKIFEEEIFGSHAVYGCCSCMAEIKIYYLEENQSKLSEEYDTLCGEYYKLTMKLDSRKKHPHSAASRRPKRSGRNSNKSEREDFYLQSTK
jgi:hypothetical protein